MKKLAISILSMFTALGLPISVLAESSMIESEVSNTYHYVDQYEILIDGSPAEVWPHFIDLGSWMFQFDMKHESGPENSEGAVFRLYEGQNFFFEIVKILPEKMIVGVNLPSTMKGEEAIGVAMITLTEIDGKTLVSNFMNRQYAWFEDGPNPGKQTRGTDEFKEFNQALWNSFLGRLKELVEK